MFTVTNFVIELLYIRIRLIRKLDDSHQMGKLSLKVFPSFVPLQSAWIKIIDIFQLHPYHLFVLITELKKLLIQWYSKKIWIAIKQSPDLLSYLYTSHNPLPVVWQMCIDSPIKLKIQFQNQHILLSLNSRLWKNRFWPCHFSTCEFPVSGLLI